MRILLDMDDVLVDFLGGAAKEWGTTLEELKKHWPTGYWSMEAALTAYFKAHNIPWVKGTQITHKDVQDSLACRYTFWEELQPLPWFEDLLSLIKSVTDDWHIVTSPMNCRSSHVGKCRWLKNYFGESFDRFAITSYKHLYAKKGVVLIDDREETIRAFRKEGGMGIIFPRHNNSQHMYESNPLERVRHMLKYMTKL